MRDLLRQKSTPYDELQLDNSALGEDALIEAMVTYPILMNRPIVVTPLGSWLCQPSEVVLTILPQSQQGAFSKEDGEQVINSEGTRL